jgi:transcriptional regulator of arginine metabolism
MTPRLRQEAIAAILDEGRVPSQRDLIRRLRARRVRVSQATLSRDLREMGVVRSPRGYARPQAVQAQPAPHSQQVAPIVRTFVRFVAAAGCLAVVKTDPGHAHTLGVALDAARWEEVVGTVAGDDTVFLATPDGKSAEAVVQRIMRFLR